MSPEAQQIAIAEACGWKDHLNEDGSFQAYYSADGGYVTADPLNDLNAMHEAEKVLNGIQRLQYSNALDDATADKVLSFYMIHATAAQRAEAFLRTLGKWEDGK